MKISRMYMPFFIAVFFPVMAAAGTTAVKDKVAVLITTWGMPAGYSFEYSWHSSEYSRCGDVTDAGESALYSSAMLVNFLSRLISI